MEFFIHTADTSVIGDMLDYGAVAGVSTDPSLVSEQGVVFASLLSQIAGMVDGVVFGEVISHDHAGMVFEATELANLGENINISIPMCVEGLRAIALLNKRGIKTNCTLVFSPVQALLAARAGASYVSAFVGGTNQSGTSGVELVADIVEIFAVHRITCKIIACDIQSSNQVIECAKAGAHIASVTPQVFAQMLEHPLTTKNQQKYSRDHATFISAL